MNIDGLARAARPWGARAALFTLFLMGCTGGSSADEPVGQVQLALSLPDGTAVNSVAWKILSSSNAVIVSGTLNTSGTRTPSLIASLPAATGDKVNMTATTTAGVSCAGTSPSFDVVAGQSTSVAVNIVCEATVAEAGNGSVVVSGTVVVGDHCPTLTTWLITPQQTAAADPIDIAITAADADVGETFTYAWTATAGTFASATAATTQYTCTTPGAQTLSVAVTDSHAPVPCTTHVTFPAVSCL
jgi:hypothetical protein